MELLYTFLIILMIIKLPKIIKNPIVECIKYFIGSMVGWTMLLIFF